MCAVLRIEYPFLADGVADAQNRPPEHLPAECLRVNDGAHVGDREKIGDVVLAGFDIDLDFGKAGDVGERLSVVRICCLSRPRSIPARRALQWTPWCIC